MIKTRRTSRFLVPIALFAIGLSAFVFTGCEKKEEAPQPPAPPAHAPESYMHDDVFRGQLRADQLERQKLLRARNEITAKMREKIEAAKARLGTADEAKLKAELEKDAEWNDLYKRCDEANAQILKQQKKTLQTVRQRLTPPKQISK